jgi:hypothetical protein
MTGGSSQARRVIWYDRICRRHEGAIAESLTGLGEENVERGKRIGDSIPPSYFLLVF